MFASTSTYKSLYSRVKNSFFFKIKLNLVRTNILSAKVVFYGEALYHAIKASKNLPWYTKRHLAQKTSSTLKTVHVQCCKYTFETNIYMYKIRVALCKDSNLFNLETCIQSFRLQCENNFRWCLYWLYTSNVKHYEFT